MSQVMTATSSSRPVLDDSEAWEKVIDPPYCGLGRRQAGSGPLPHLYCDDARGDDKQAVQGSGKKPGGSESGGDRGLDGRGESDEDEGWLLQQLAGGDRAAFWKLWQLHRSYLFGICAKHAGGINEEAEDVLSRAMLRAFEKMPAYAARINSPKAWLTRLTINLCVDMFRESKRRSSKTTNLDDLTAADAQPVSSRNDSPEEALLRLEMQSRLNGALRELPAQVRGPFLLHFTEEVPCEDVGKAFSITAANVRKRIQRARYLLKQKLEPVGGCRL